MSRMFCHTAPSGNTGAGSDVLNCAMSATRLVLPAMCRVLLIGLVACAAGCATVQVDAGAKEIYRVGRFSDDARFLWSASRFSLRFRGEGTVRARLRQTTHPASPEGGPQALRVRAELDGRVSELYADGHGQLLFEGEVHQGEHRLTLVRQSEALVGEGQLLGFELPADARMLEWDRKGDQLLEFIGDSVTVGFGDEGAAPCRYSSRTQAISSAFPWLVGEALHADVRVVGWSGHGVTRNYGDRSEPVLPEQWVPAQPAPDMVFVTLGANDFWNGDPGPSFLPAYRAFLARIRAAYPDAKIHSLAWGPRRELLRSAGLDPIELSDLDSHGCVGHPSARSHARIASEVIAALAGRPSRGPSVAEEPDGP
jgi:hypothetical protein